MDNLSIRKKWKCDHLLLSHLESHSVNIKSLILSYNDIKHCLINACRQFLMRLYTDRINRLTYQKRLSGLHIKILQKSQYHKNLLQRPITKFP